MRKLFWQWSRKDSADFIIYVCHLQRMCRKNLRYLFSIVFIHKRLHHTENKSLCGNFSSSNWLTWMPSSRKHFYSSTWHAFCFCPPFADSFTVLFLDHAQDLFRCRLALPKYFPQGKSETNGKAIHNRHDRRSNCNCSAPQKHGRTAGNSPQHNSLFGHDILLVGRIFIPENRHKV